MHGREINAPERKVELKEGAHSPHDSFTNNSSNNQDANPMPWTAANPFQQVEAHKNGEKHCVT